MGIIENPWNLNGSKGSFLFKNNLKIQNVNILSIIKKKPQIWFEINSVDIFRKVCYTEFQRTTYNISRGERIARFLKS